MIRCCHVTVLLIAPWLPRAFGKSSQPHPFTARWNTPDNGYLPLPRSLWEAGMGTLWRRAGFEKTLNLIMVSHIEDPRFLLLFDKHNTIAGVSFGFDKNDVNRVRQQDSSHVYAFPDSMYRSAKLWEKDVWLSFVLFADPEVIRTTGRPGLSSTDDVISELHYWADYGWRTAPRLESDVTGAMVPQGCYRGMGKHYFHKSDTNSSASCDLWQGFFATYDRGVLSGFGVMVFGSFVSTYFTPTYYEYPDFSVVRAVLPNRPACVDEWLPVTGVTSVHVFVTADAANISCSMTTESADQLADQPWYHNLSWPWLHPTVSSANPDIEPSYLTTIAFSAAIIYYYFSFCGSIRICR